MQSVVILLQPRICESLQEVLIPRNTAAVFRWA
jgi:hypothetical protein